MSVVEAILRMVDTIGNWFGLLIQRITNIRDGLLNILSYIGSIFSTLWYGLTSLLSPLGELIKEVLAGELFYNIGKGFSSIAGYIGGPATVFIASLMLVAMLRMIIAFVFKIMRLNIDYKPKGHNGKKSNVDDIVKDFHQSVE